MEHLKQCPFCNGLPHYEPSEVRESVMCIMCGVTMAQMVDNNRAIPQPTLISRWNARYSERESGELLGVDEDERDIYRSGLIAADIDEAIRALEESADYFKQADCDVRSHECWQAAQRLRKRM